MPRHTAPVGAITRGTTNTNRLRRIDHWIARHPRFSGATSPRVVDLGYGASGVTAFELEHRLRLTKADVDVVGIEISADRVAHAREQLREVREGLTPFAPDAQVSFHRGGFETPLPDGKRATVVRAFNVLRQYDEAAVLPSWKQIVKQLAPEGMLVEGTCDEIGRIASWVAVTSSGPQSLTISLRLDTLEDPVIVAERLPKILIHRNVEGEAIHALMTDLDQRWKNNAPLAVFGNRQRFLATVTALVASGWHVLDAPKQWRSGEFTVAWRDIAPLGFAWDAT